MKASNIFKYTFAAVAGYEIGKMVGVVAPTAALYVVKKLMPEAYDRALKKLEK